MPPIFPARPDAPRADRRPTSATYHNVTIHDDYGWLRAPNWQEAMRDPGKLPEDIASYLTAENAYYEAAMADTQDLQAQLIAEMRGRIKEDDESVPQAHGPYLYGHRSVDGGEYFKLTRSLKAGGPEEILLDVDEEARDQAYFDLGGTAVSPDHRYMGWSADTNGSEFFTLRFRDTQTGRDTGVEIADVDGFAWGDEATIFYARVDADHRPTRIFRHVLHSDPSGDVLVYEETDPRYFVGVERVRSGGYIAIWTGMNDENEILVIPTDDLTAPPRLIAPRTPGLEYQLDHAGDRFFIRTNDAGALDFKLVTASVSAPDRDNWTDLVPHQAGRMLVGYGVLQDWLVWMERDNALPRIRMMRHGADPAQAGKVDFAEEAYALGIHPSLEFDTDILRFSYESPTTPSALYDYDLSTGDRVLRKRQEIPSGHDPADYVTRRVQAVSHDGAEVPVTILHHKDTPLDGSAPCYLYGYGSYGASMPAGFNANRLSLVDRGWIAATAHIRGGEEKGRGWYEDAKFGKKVNSFHDFIASARHLIDQGFTGERRIVISGGSAGGLLVGAVVNMAPELLAGVVADVPFVDVLNTILDDTLPLTPGEWSQWGNPIDSAQAFDDIAGYAPYENVTAQDYPPMLVTAGVSDPRVTYWEPAKWVARLRATKTDDNALLLRTNMTSGHFGKTGRFAALEDAARTYAFALKCVGQA